MKIWSYVTIDMLYPICDLNQSHIFGVYMHVLVQLEESNSINGLILDGLTFDNHSKIDVCTLNCF